MSQTRGVNAEFPGVPYRLAIGIPIRDVAHYLPRLFRVLREVASACTDVRIVLVENDSADATVELATNFAESDRRVSLLRYPGLGELVPERTDRIAFARNSIVEEFVALTAGDDGWTAVMLDADEVTSELTGASMFDLVDFLHQHPEFSGATANSQPVYYDVWTLRCDGWSPDDCWTRVHRRAPSLPYSDAVRTFVTARQRPIDSTSPPIPVSSAFGGLAAYHLTDIKQCRYRGHSSGGEPCSDHVPMHAELSALTGKPLAIVPSVNMVAPTQHISTSLPAEDGTGPRDRRMWQGAGEVIGRVVATGTHTGRRLTGRADVRRRRTSEQQGRRTSPIDEFRLVMSADHALPRYAAQFRAYDRPVRSIGLALRRAYGRRIRAVDVGANIGDTTVALVVATGAEVLAIEGDQRYLEALRQNTSPISDRVTIFDGFVTSEGASFAGLVRTAGTARLRTHQPAVAAKGTDIETFAVRDVLSQVGWGAADLFKSDTDGADFGIIHAALEFPWDAKPVLFFEFDPSLDSGGAAAGLAVVEEAISMGYRRWYIWDNFGNFVSKIEIDHLKWFGLLTRYLDHCRASGGGLYYLDVAAFAAEHPPYDGAVQLRPR